MAVEIDSSERSRKIRRSIESVFAESPKKDSPYCYDRIQAWIANNRTGNRAMYLSARVRTSNLSLTEATWTWNMLTRRSDRTETNVILGMPGHIRSAIQTYHDLARRDGLILTSNREPSELIITPDPAATLDPMREQLGVIFNCDVFSAEVEVCMRIFGTLFPEDPRTYENTEERRDLSNQFVLYLLISLRSDNPLMFRNAVQVGSHVWTLVSELLCEEEKIAVEDRYPIFSPGTLTPRVRAKLARDETCGKNRTKPLGVLNV